MKKNIFVAATIVLIEWIEFSFYAYLVAKLSPLFFAGVSAHLAILMGFGSFAVSYFARPIGGIIFGYIGDYSGRKPALFYSMTLMGIVTFAIGLLPTYTMIGILAPILLIIFRFLQGLAVAGNLTGAAIFIAEHHNNKSYLVSSWVSTFSALGMLIGAATSIIVSLTIMPAWAWRVPFIFIGIIGVIFAGYVRHSLTEPKIYQAEKYKGLIATLILTLIKNYKMPMLKTAALAAFVGVYIYTCNVWWVSYAIENNYFTNVQARSLATLGQASVVILTPLMAMLGDVVGGYLLMTIGFIGAAITAFLLFALTGFYNIYVIGAVHILYALFNTSVTAVMFKYLVDIFPTKVRYSGQAISWNIAVAIFGGTAPFIAQLLSESYKAPFIPSLYVIAIALVALLVNGLPQKSK